MGLHVHVYQNIKITENEDYSFKAYVIDPDWIYKVKNLEYDKYYKGDLTDASISYSCGSHNQFRETLIKIIGRNDLLLSDGRINWFQLEKEKNIPFYELINFADNEGCLDFEISGILYKNFIDWENRAMEFLSANFLARENYINWINIFKDGKDNGVVVFG